MQTVRGENSFRNVIKLQGEKCVSHILNIGRGKKELKEICGHNRASSILLGRGPWGRVRREGGKIGQLREEELTGICFADSVHRSRCTSSFEAFVIYISSCAVSYSFSASTMNLPAWGLQRFNRRTTV